MTQTDYSRFNCGPSHAPAVLEVDLGAIAENFRTLSELSGVNACAAVIKANGYGLGAAPVARKLYETGCRVFFTAQLSEAIAVREELVENDAEIGVLNGWSLEDDNAYETHRLFPVLNTLDQVQAWHESGSMPADGKGAAIQVDTGMTRLGLPQGDVAALVRKAASAPPYRFLISHMASADTPSAQQNIKQRQEFEEFRALIPHQRAMLAASSASFLGPEWRFDMLRVGVALFGGRPVADKPNPLRPVVALKARILQVQSVEPGKTVGYGASYTVERPSVIATVGVGYADGYHRALSNRAEALLHGERINLVGRVSMDLLTFDVTDAPNAKAGDWVSLINETISIDELADHAGTIGYEILTSLGPRYRRIYLG